MDWTGVEPQLLRAEDVRRFLGIGRTKVYEMIAQGELPVLRLGRQVRIPRAALAQWVAEQTRIAEHRE
ncbi:MAG: DNA-binding protein [Candidatus Nephthysia bennettiae]|jgi:excisionase family DNA binding protein|nr:MAG: DNA-binding protein [Candidatus Dormibacteraeota bacterium]